jgi:antirestriction protein ArdC
MPHSTNAELGSALVCAHLGITPEVQPNHAESLDRWLTVLKANKQAIFTAVSHAQKAVDYVLSINHTQFIREVL